MRGSFKLGKIAGIEIGIHYTWIFAFILFTWIFASSTFPTLYAGWSGSTYWIAGGAVSILLFASVLIHELCHSLVAQRRGMKVSSIVLFIFGGVSNIEAEPEKASAEFIMAGASAVSIGTMNLINPATASDCVINLKEYMIKENINDINELVGIAHR